MVQAARNRNSDSHRKVQSVLPVSYVLYHTQTQLFLSLFLYVTAGQKEKDGGNRDEEEKRENSK